MSGRWDNKKRLEGRNLARRRVPPNESIDERAIRQRERALMIARQLTGKPNPSRNVVNSLLALVVADERTDLPDEVSVGPAPGSRQVLRPRKRAPKQVQDALW